MDTLERVHGKLVVARDKGQIKCMACTCEEECLRTLPDCTPETRDDNRDVYFVDVEEYNFVTDKGEVI